MEEQQQKDMAVSRFGVINDLLTRTRMDCDCHCEWPQRHPGYYKKYRQDHPVYHQRNTLLQGYRNTKARMIAKMDPSVQKVFLIPMGYNPLETIAKQDSIPSRDLGC